MKTRFRLALAQINTTVGDLPANVRKIRLALLESRRAHAQLVVYPELTVPGYPPEDLLFKRSFVDANLAAVKRLAPFTRGLTALVGFIDRDESGRLFNAAAALSDGKWVGSYRKIELPNYGVFDEKRYFERGEKGLLLETGSLRIGITICEDVWMPDSFAYREPYRDQTSLIVNLSASPYHAGKLKVRQDLARTLAQRTGAHVAYLNLVGGQDELVFDGGSFVVTREGRIAAQAAYFEEDLCVTDLDLPAQDGRLGETFADACDTLAVEAKTRPGKALRALRRPMPLDEEEEVYRALVLGTRDYVEKNGFAKVLIGLSGGIDSALVAQIAVDALGPGRVIGVTMPSRFTSRGTLKDSLRLARNLKMRILTIGIEHLFEAYLETLAPAFQRNRPGIAEENLQARIRGNLLMALSNKFGHLVLTTGNKSEMATGYCTLYGDMAGGFAVIKDVPKTLVYRLARFRNKRGAAIPASLLRRAPTAELRKGQKDSDSLPPYPVLDAVLRRYIEEDRSTEELVRAGFSRGLVLKIARLVDRNEYKRRQAPPGIKITPKAFGRDRRMPITNKFGS